MINQIVSFIQARIDEDWCEPESLAPWKNPREAPLFDRGVEVQRMADAANAAVLVLNDQQVPRERRDAAIRLLRDLAVHWSWHPNYRSEWSVT